MDIDFDKPVITLWCSEEELDEIAEDNHETSILDQDEKAVLWRFIQQYMYNGVYPMWEDAKDWAWGKFEEQRIHA